MTCIWRDDAVSMAKLFKSDGYDTAYVGKWHVDGRGRSNYIPPESRQGFDYWKALECTHDYNNSRFYAGDSDQPLNWEGYDAIEQTKDVQAYLRGRGRSRDGDGKSDTPFLLVLSWGPPHAPYETAPEAYRQMYDPHSIELRPNVPPEMAEEARNWIAGYYAHCTALDDCLGALLQTLEDEGFGGEHDLCVHIGSRRHARLAGGGQKAAPLGKNQSECLFCYAGRGVSACRGARSRPCWIRLTSFPPCSR